MNDTIFGDTSNSRYNANHPHGKPTLVGAHPGPALQRLADGRLLRCAGVLVQNAHGQILVGFNLKRQCWDIPQGVVENGEEPAEAALRELREETGLEAEASELEYLGNFMHQTSEFVYAFSNNIYALRSGQRLDLREARNVEESKCSQMLWVAPCQCPFPRGLALRMALVILGAA